MYNNIIMSATALNNLEGNTYKKAYQANDYLSVDKMTEDTEQYVEGDTTFYIIDSTYMRVGANFVQRYYVRTRIEGLSELMEYLIQKNRYYSYLPSGIAKAIMSDKSITIKPRVASDRKDTCNIDMESNFDADSIDPDDYNMDALLNLPLTISWRIVECHNDLKRRRDLLLALIKQHVDINMTNQYVDIFNTMIGTYFVLKYETVDKDNAEMTDFIEIVEQQLNSKAKTVKRIMTEIFRPSAYNNEYLKHNHHMLNNYYIYYPQSYTVKAHIKQNLKPVKNIHDLNIKELVNYSYFSDMVPFFSTLTDSDEISAIVARIYKVTEDTAGVTHDIMNMLLSMLDLDTIKEHDHGLIAKAFVDNFNAMSSYNRTAQLASLLTKPENVDYIAETIVDELVTRRNMSHLLDNLYDYCIADKNPYIYKAIQVAVENSEHKKVKKYLFKRGV